MHLIMSSFTQETHTVNKESGTRRLSISFTGLDMRHAFGKVQTDADDTQVKIIS